MKYNLQQSKKAFERIEIPKIFHPFITGGHNEKLNALMKETGVKIHVPPPSVNRDEITIAGDKEGVQSAIETIKQIYTKMVCVYILIYALFIIDSIMWFVYFDCRKKNLQLYLWRYQNKNISI